MQLQPLPDPQICHKTVWRMSRPGTPAKGCYAVNSAWQHKSSTVLRVQTVVVCVDVAAPHLCLQHTDECWAAAMALGVMTLGRKQGSLPQQIPFVLALINVTKGF